MYISVTSYSDTASDSFDAAVWWICQTRCFIASRKFLTVIWLAWHQGGCGWSKVEIPNSFTRLWYGKRVLNDSNNARPSGSSFISSQGHYHQMIRHRWANLTPRHLVGYLSRLSFMLLNLLYVYIFFLRELHQFIPSHVVQCSNLRLVTFFYCITQSDVMWYDIIVQVYLQRGFNWIESTLRHCTWVKPTRVWVCRCILNKLNINVWQVQYNQPAF